MPVIATADKLEKEACEWLEFVTGQEFDQNKTIQENLKDGTILCKAFNGCFSDLKVKYTHSAMPFKQMENIATFLHALSKLPNFRSFDLFSTVDLYEGKNMAQVIRCILACKRFAEKDALGRRIENLNIKPKPEVKEDVKIAANEAKEVKEEKEEENMKPEHDVKSNAENGYESESFVQEDETVDPEIVLVDSPVYADDEAETSHDASEEEEYETFTTDNPGTFEFQVSN